MEVKQPQKLMSYFLLQKKNLLIVTVTGIIYNMGMTAGPYFEGRLAQCLFDLTKGEKTWKNMAALAVVYLLVIFFVQASRVFKRFYVRRFANDTSRNMRHMLYNSIIHSSKRKLEQEQLGMVMTKAISDVDACVEGMRKFTTEVFDTGVVMVAYGVLLCVYDVRLAVLSGLFIPVAYVIAEQCKGVVSRCNEVYKKNSGRLNQSTMDLIGNVMTYRVFGLEKIREDRYEADLTTYEKSAVKANIWESAMQPLYYTIAMCGAVLIFYFGGKNVQGTGWTVWDIGAFTTFFSCFAKLALKSSKAAKLFNAVQKAAVSWKRIKPSFQDYVREEPVADEKLQKLEFINADIFYPDQEPVLRQVSFCAKQGQMIGITGGIASGKSAIGKLFVGEADYRGHVLLDGTEFKQMEERDRVGIITYMGHEPELISTDVEENIVLEEGQSAGAAWALEQVCLKKEVWEMPEGVRTIVGNGGTRLSGGQQSRLALARCFYHGKALLILDDPLAAVDQATEKEVFQNLQAFTKDRITLLITHRLSLFPKLDGVLFLHDGTASFGTHEELMQREPVYLELFSGIGESGSRADEARTDRARVDEAGKNGSRTDDAGVQENTQKQEREGVCHA